LTTRKCGN